MMKWLDRYEEWAWQLPLPLSFFMLVLLPVLLWFALWFLGAWIIGVL